MRSSFATTPNTFETPNRLDVDDASALPKNHQQVFERVWGEVEKIIHSFCDKLFENLSDPTFSLDHHERTISYLLDLDTDRDPLWTYLDSQYRSMATQIREAYKQHYHLMSSTHPSLSTFA